MAKYDLDYYEEIRLAEEGDLDAMFNVASYMVWGDQTSPMDPDMAETAIKYYSANADNGDTDAMLDLGAMYLVGRGVKQNREKALMWYKKAADLDGQRACRCIGNLYRYDNLDDGTPVPTSDRERLRQAFEWYKKGAESGEENCLYELGDYYRFGRLVEKDEAKAFDLYSLALEVIEEEIMTDHFLINDSYADVCLRLAECYHYAIGTEKNMIKAKELIQTALMDAESRAKDGDPYGSGVLIDVRKEWQAIMAETEFA
jgi:TPR repeat protein